MRNVGRPDGTSPEYLFPHFICRISGVPASAVEELRFAEIVEPIERLLKLDSQLRATRDDVSDQLHREVGRVAAPHTRKSLIQLRRDLFNLRLPNGEAIDHVLPDVPESVRELILVHSALLAERDQIFGDFSRLHRAAADAARSRLRQAISTESFQRGLLLSSPSLFAAQRRYLSTEVGAAGSRNDQVERGLLRYFSRAAMKATPFGTLCSVIAGRFDADPPPAETRGHIVRLEGQPSRQRSFVRLNKLLYGIVASHMVGRPSIRQRLPIEQNPTLREEQDGLVFLTVSRGREVFRRAAPNPALELVTRIVGQCGAVPFRDLARLLIESPELDATEDDVTAYLDGLVQSGLLRFRLGVREQDVDWDLRLCSLLESIDDDDHARLIANTLGRLRFLGASYATGDIEQRVRVLQESRDALGEMLDALNIKMLGASAILPFLEDATADASAVVGWSLEIKRVEDCLADLVRITRAVARPRAEQATMRVFFDRYYGSGTNGIPLLQFYEDFYREHFKEHLARQQRRQRDETDADTHYDLANPYGVDLIGKMRAAERSFLNLVSDRWRQGTEAEELHLSSRDLRSLLADVERPAEDPVSVGAFAVLVPASSTQGELRILLRNAGYSAGYGRFFSRFLYLVPEHVTGTLNRTYADTADTLTAEICGDANHNANLHPPILPWEISYPTGESGLAGEQILAAHVVVEPHDGDYNALVLRHTPSGKRVIPVDLGFVTPSARPPLYQLLSRFTPSSEYALPLPDVPYTISPVLRDGPHAADVHPHAQAAEGALADAAPDGYGTPRHAVLRRPRIVLDDAIVLARQRWWVSHSNCPQIAAGESAHDFFLRVNRWRTMHGIPAEAFVRIFPFPGGTPLRKTATPQTPEDPEPDQPPSPPLPNRAWATERATRNLLKPQYIDFLNPLFVDLFGRMGSNLGLFTAVVEERYPPASALPEVLGRQYAAEQVIQLDFPAC